MTFIEITTGVLITTAVVTFSIQQLEDKLDAVQDIKYEKTEAITKKTSLKDSIEIVKRNDLRRQKLVFDLNSTLNPKK